MSELLDSIDYNGSPERENLNGKQMILYKSDWARVIVLELFFMFTAVVFMYAGINFILGGFGITLTAVGVVLIAIVSLVVFSYPFFVLSKKVCVF